MPSQSLKSKVAKGAVWTLLEKLSTQIVGFVVGMMIAHDGGANEKMGC